MNNILSTKEAAEILGVSPKTLYDWRERRKKNLPFYKISEKKIVYNRADVERYLRNCRVEPVYLQASESM